MHGQLYSSLNLDINQNAPSLNPSLISTLFIALPGQMSTNISQVAERLNLDIEMREIAPLDKVIMPPHVPLHSSLPVTLIMIESTHPL